MAGRQEGRRCRQRTRSRSWEGRRSKQRRQCTLYKVRATNKTFNLIKSIDIMENPWNKRQFDLKKEEFD